MLRRLSVENYALIDALDIEFASGLNTITGETGAGKSILLGALALVLGGRGDVAALKDEGRNCVIEAEFEVDGYGLESLFESLDVDYQQVTDIRRIITPAGKSRAYVNDIPVSLAALKEIGARLIDIHSQHQTLLAGDERFHIRVVDSIAAHGALLDRYRDTFARMRAAERELAELHYRAGESRKDFEYVSFQLNQLQEAKLTEGEQEELERLLNELTHASEIRETLLFGAEALDGDDENGMLIRLKNLELSIGRLHGFYAPAGDYAVRLRSVILELKDLSGELSAEGGRIEADDERMQRTRERLDTLYSLQQKHHVTSVAELLALQGRYEEQLRNIEGYDEAIRQLTETIHSLKSEATKLAGQITVGRQKAAPVIEKHVAETLARLGMPAAQLKVEIAPADLSTDGADAIRFLFTANRNMPLQPIDRVASGGEMSRLMLALKSLVARQTQLPTIIFDEIDAGVSGSIADRMGEIMVALAGNLQIINITHLPQVASKGDHHFYVYKADDAVGTATCIRKLGAEERVGEIAQMLSGADVTPAAREQARLLLGK